MSLCKPGDYSAIAQVAIWSIFKNLWPFQTHTIAENAEVKALVLGLVDWCSMEKEVNFDSEADAEENARDV